MLQNVSVPVYLPLSFRSQVVFFAQVFLVVVACPPAAKRNMMIAKICAIFFLLAVLLQTSQSTEMVRKEHLSRIKRQSYGTNNDIGNAFIDSVFNIPISTLNAVGQLIKNSRPVVQEVRRRAEQQYSQYQDNRRKTSTTVQYIDLRRTTPRTSVQRRRTSADVAGVRPAYDGSSYRI